MKIVRTMNQGINSSQRLQGNFRFQSIADTVTSVRRIPPEHEDVPTVRAKATSHSPSEIARGPRHSATIHLQCIEVIGWSFNLLSISTQAVNRQTHGFADNDTQRLSPIAIPS